MLGRILVLSLLVLVAGCKIDEFGPVSAEQYGDFTVSGLDRAELNKCFHNLLKTKAHTATWRIVGTGQLVARNIMQTGRGRDRAVTNNLRSVHVKVQGKGALKVPMKLTYSCLYDIKGGRPRYIGNCLYNPTTKVVELCSMIPEYQDSIYANPRAL